MALKILGVDFETQSADALTTNITEVGASLWESTNDARTLYEKSKGYSQFVCEENYPPQTEKIIKLTGITDQMLRVDGKHTRQALEGLFSLLEETEIIFAHKVDFDKTVLYQTCKRFDLKPPEREWVCTLTNFPWPEEITCKKLSHIAYEHGILVDPRTLHRAENDCDLMMRLITNYYIIDDVLAYAREPWVYLKADILGPWQGRGGDGGTQSTIAKSLGFNFERCKGTDGPSWPKTWVARFKQREVDQIFKAVSESESPFRVSKIEGL